MDYPKYKEDNPMKILIVEDEKRMAQALCQLLRLEKYEVDHCDNGLDGLYAIESGIYDAVVLDVMLPHKNGFDIAREARKQGIKTPILMQWHRIWSWTITDAPPSVTSIMTQETSGW